MRIESAQTSAIQPAASRPVRYAQPEATASVNRRADQVQLSNETASLRRAHKAAADAPDVRAERVATIKSAIEAGTYQVDNMALAEKLLNANVL